MLAKPKRKAQENFPGVIFVTKSGTLGEIRTYGRCLRRTERLARTLRWPTEFDGGSDLSQTVLVENHLQQILQKCPQTMCVFFAKLQPRTDGFFLGIYLEICAPKVPGKSSC